MKGEKIKEKFVQFLLNGTFDILDRNMKSHVSRTWLLYSTNVDFGEGAYSPRSNKKNIESPPWIIKLGFYARIVFSLIVGQPVFSLEIGADADANDTGQGNFCQTLPHFLVDMS